MVTSSGTARRQVAGEGPALRVVSLHHAERQRRGTQPARLRAVRGGQANEARALPGLERRPAAREPGRAAAARPGWPRSQLLLKAAISRDIAHARFPRSVSGLR